jgi:predicted membrane protein
MILIERLTALQIKLRSPPQAKVGSTVARLAARTRRHVHNAVFWKFLGTKPLGARVSIAVMKRLFLREIPNLRSRIHPMGSIGQHSKRR